MISNNLIGYDLDGTICDKMPKRDKPFMQQKSAERKAYQQVRINHIKNAKIILQPTGDFVIITARKEFEKNDTLQWLMENNIKPTGIYFFNLGRTKKNMILYKSDIINKSGVTIFYEDDPLIIKGLKKLCPNTNFIQC